MHLLAIGQSNLGNHLESKHSCSFGTVLHEGRHHAVADPIPGASGDRGSIWPLVARLADADPLVTELTLTVLATSGTSIADWAHAGPGRDKLDAAMIHLAAHPDPVTHVVVHIGERDGYERTPKVQYHRGFQSLHRRLAGQIGSCPWILCIGSLLKGVVSPNIRAAQTLSIDAVATVSRGPDTDMLGAEYRIDGTHLNDAGATMFARALWSAITATNDAS